jgi:hypothetical protein
MDIMGVLGGIFPFERTANAAGSRREAPQFGQPDELLRGNAQGLAGMFRRWRASAIRPARLALVERITLGPRQALLLVEADGVRLLVATSSDGASAFYPLPAGSTEAAEEFRLRPMVTSRIGLVGRTAGRMGSGISTSRNSGRVSW